MGVRSHQQKHNENTATDLTLLSVTGQSQNPGMVLSWAGTPSTAGCSKACPAWMVMPGHGG